MVQRLIRDLFLGLVWKLIDQYAPTRIWTMPHHVNLVKCNPVCHLITVTIEERFRIFHEEWNQLTAVPTVIFARQRQRSLIMRQRNDWFDAVLF
ncbi:hypothetical protein D3C75_1090130 [compost metagenome]